MESSQRPVRVVVVDDHPFFRDGITRGLQFSGRIAVVGEAADGQTALEVIGREKPDVAVVDYHLPGVDGIGVVHAVIRDGMDTKVVLLSAETGGATVFRALEEGAKGYLSKDSSREQIIDAVLAVARGTTVVPPELAGGLADQIRLRARSDAPALTPREREVLQGFARGLSIPQLASELFLGASTVKTHTQRLYEKLGVSDRAAAVAEAMRRGMLE